MADISIYGALKAMTGEGKAAYASQIYDEALGKFQSQINQEGGGGGGSTDAYWATYGTTTYSDLVTNFNGDKIVAMVYSNTLYIMVAYDNSNAIFASTNGNTCNLVTIAASNSAYTASTVTSYVKPSGGIPSTDLASGVIPDVSGKEDKSNKVSSWQTTPDNTHYPSEKLVYDEIGNVESVLDAILGSATLPTEKKTTIVSASGTTLSADLDNYYLFSSEVGTLAITLPAPNDLTHITKIVFAFTTGSSPAVTFTATAISGNTPPIYAQDRFAIEASTTYEVSAIFNGVCWVVASLKIGATAISSSSSS